MSDVEQGKVWLVGAGPGAPNLITMRGAEVLRKAQVVIYDHLVNEELLNLAPADAEFIYAGKRGGDRPVLTQDEINSLMVGRAREGKRVVRLKGGDPLIFGRGGEEMLVLAEAGIEFEVVPGVSSAIAGPAFAGIPITHRNHGSFVAFVTGHEGYQKPADKGVPWQELAVAASHGGTLVLLMATSKMEEIMNGLVEYGLPAHTPAAAIQSASTASQKTVLGTVKTLPHEAKIVGIKPPSIIVVGQCAEMAEKLSWFERKPLFGKRLLVTRSYDKVGYLASALTELGAEVVSFPTIELVEPDSYEALDSALARLADFDWVVFTSPEGVARFIARLSLLERDVRELSKARIAAVGPATAAKIKSYGLRVALMPKEFCSEALAHAFSEDDVRGRNFLLPRAQVANELLPKLLMKRGARSVEQVAVYKTQKPSPRSFAQVSRAITEGTVDLALFTSPSTAINLKDILGERALKVPAAVIGPVTGAACKELGFEVVVEATEHTIAGLVDAVKKYFEQSSLRSS